MNGMPFDNVQIRIDDHTVLSISQGDEMRFVCGVREEGTVEIAIIRDGVFVLENQVEGYLTWEGVHDLVESYINERQEG